jgi:hypothetical protein
MLLSLSAVSQYSLLLLPIIASLRSVVSLGKVCGEVAVF